MPELERKPKVRLCCDNSQLKLRCMMYDISYDIQEQLVRRLLSWAMGDEQPLASYAVGLLGAAMEIQEIAANFKENNSALVKAYCI